MAAEYRRFDVGSYNEAAVDELQEGEELVVSGPTGDGRPKNGHVPLAMLYVSDARGVMTPLVTYMKMRPPRRILYLYTEFLMLGVYVVQCL